MTEHLYVVGCPVSHSKSPAMHAAAYQALGLDWQYDLMECVTRDQARAFFARGDWLACNVTMPYKPLALEVATCYSNRAACAQGANVLVRTEGGLYADNVDGVGCVWFLRHLGIELTDARVAVCGTGATALAIVGACEDAGARSVALFGRTMQKTQQVIEGYRTWAREVGALSVAELSACDYVADARALAEADIIVDATPLGMTPHDPAPFDTTLLHEGHVVLDVVYGHGQTALVKAAQDAGCTALDGSGMLVGQAVETIRVLAEITGRFTIPSGCDLFGLMAEAAGFDLQVAGTALA